MGKLCIGVYQKNIQALLLAHFQQQQISKACVNKFQIWKRLLESSSLEKQNYNLTDDEDKKTFELPKLDDLKLSENDLQRAREVKRQNFDKQVTAEHYIVTTSQEIAANIFGGSLEEASEIVATISNIKP